MFLYYLAKKAKKLTIFFFLFTAAYTMKGGEEPNTYANLVDMGFPGMLPVLNEDCLDIAIKASLALGGRILPQIKFDRKHYVYADLPQAYQITQKHYPIMLDGRLFFYDYQNEENHILIQRIQMEQVRFCLTCLILLTFSNH